MRQLRPRGQNARIEQVRAYVDGFNFYHGMMAKGWGRYRWLDYQALMDRFVRDPDHLAGVHFFTTHVTHQPDKLRRQDTYLRALEAHAHLTPILGTFEVRKVKCGRCHQWYKRPQEKRTDVSIATSLVVDAFDDRFDSFILVTADTDLIPAVAFIRERFPAKRFVLIDPPRRHSEELAEMADAHLHFAPHDLRKSQLPETVEYTTPAGRSKFYKRPEEWAT